MSQFKKFKEIFTDESSDSEKAWYREFSGKLTQPRIHLIDRFCQENTWRRECGCPGDCCGCNFERKTTWKYEAGQVVVRVRNYYNY